MFWFQRPYVFNVCRRGFFEVVNVRGQPSGLAPEAKDCQRGPVLDSSWLQWAAFAVFPPKPKVQFYTKEQVTRLDGVIETRNASLEAIRFIYLPASVYSLSVSVYFKFFLLLTSQDTQFWVIKLEEEGKDAYQLDLL